MTGLMADVIAMMTQEVMPILIPVTLVVAAVMIADDLIQLVKRAM